jgi:hypothetical protein
MGDGLEMLGSLARPEGFEPPTLGKTAFYRAVLHLSDFNLANPYLVVGAERFFNGRERA